jgi:ComF family protein
MVLQLGTAFTDVVLGVRCVGCGHPGRLCCPVCRSELEAVPMSVTTAAAVPTTAVADYAGVARSALSAYKEHGVRALDRPLGAALGRAIDAAFAAMTASAPGTLDLPVVVPVPASRAALRRRGFAPVEQLARVAVRQCGLTRLTVVPAVRYRRLVRDQAGLSASERHRNVAGAFTVKASRVRQVRGRPVIVVDDVITTGATIAELIKVLRGVGSGPVAVAVVAATRDHSS